MKKSNVILTAVAVVVSAFLLWLWYNLGFDRVDAPLDLVLSIVWWVILVIGAALVVKVEKTRREQVRTSYVCPGRIYNSETGVLTVTGASVADSLAAVLENLDYGFDAIDGPDPDDEHNPIRWTHVVRTSTYSPAEQHDDGSRDEEVWEGEVVVVETGNKIPFSSRAQLATIVG